MSAEAYPQEAVKTMGREWQFGYIVIGYAFF